MTEVFVFGSNLLGIHGAGAALAAARSHGAIRGVGMGHHGNSYAIPTKYSPKRTMPLDEIVWYVRAFITYASEHPELTFRLTAIGCGLAGYQPEDIGPMFADAPPNVIMPKEFLPWVRSQTKC